MQRYCLGFLFDPTTSEVLLIEKKRGPEYVLGKWNGLGGKVRDGESSSAAMSREFEEEAGTYTSESEWKLTGKLFVRGSQGETVAIVEVFVCWSPFIMGMVKNRLRDGNPTDETVRPFSVLALPDNIVPNVPWMLAALTDSAMTSFSAEYR